MQTEKSPPYFERILSAHIFCTAKKRTFFCYSIFSKLKQKQERTRERKNMTQMNEALISTSCFQVDCSVLLTKFCFHLSFSVFFVADWWSNRCSFFIVHIKNQCDCSSCSIVLRTIRAEPSQVEPSRIA